MWIYLYKLILLIFATLEEQGSVGTQGIIIIEFHSRERKIFIITTRSFLYVTLSCQTIPLSFASYTHFFNHNDPKQKINNDIQSFSLEYIGYYHLYLFLFLAKRSGIGLFLLCVIGLMMSNIKTATFWYSGMSCHCLSINRRLHHRHHYHHQIHINNI